MPVRGVFRYYDPVLMSCVIPLLSVNYDTDRYNYRCCRFARTNWVRRIAGVKRVDRRRMDELREEICVQMRLTGRLVKCRLRWAGQLVRMGGRENGKDSR